MALVLVTATGLKPGDPEVKQMETAGHRVVFAQRPQGGRPSEAETIAMLQGVAGVIASASEPYTEPVLAAAKDLKVIVRMGVGYDNVDVAACTRHGILACTCRGSNHFAVADFAFAMMLALARDIVGNHLKVKAGQWGRQPGADFDGATLGIVGLGLIGKECARRARGFNMRVLAYDVVQDDAFAREHRVEYVDLPTLMRESDYITVHTVLDETTRGLIGAKELALMKPTAYIINTARGGIIDEDALYDALKQRRIAGAGLDVFVNEPPTGPSARFLELDNVLLAPHAAGGNQRSLKLSREICAQTIISVLSGGPPHYALNPEVLAAWRQGR